MLSARTGLLIPNGNDDQSHHGTTLLARRKAGASAAGVMVERRGHRIGVVTVQIAARVPSAILFMTVGIAGHCAGGRSFAAE